MKKIILLSCILILLPLSAFATTINVPADQSTIQAGIDASADGDIVLLANGTYTGTGNYNVDLSGKSITIKSAGGPENCIVDCELSGRGFLVYLGETVTFEGLTVKNGDAGELKNGGGIYANASEVIVVDCIFEGNSARDGGAVYSNSSSFTNCTFISNNASCDGGAVFALSSSFTNCTFTSNSASYKGGAVYSLDSSFTNCTFTLNEATEQGGAVYSEVPSSFTNCTFTDNSASYGGGAISSDSSSFTNCTFTLNSANIGGAVESSNSSSFTNCTFTSNSAYNIGGAVYARSSSFTNCTFTLNEATEQGGAIWCDIPLAPEDPITLKNCILWGNLAPEGSEIYENEKPLIITYSDIQGGHTGEGNLDVDPLFVNPDDDFHLQLTSPCIDTGTAEDAPSDDLDGNYRPVGSGYDMGAYEYQGPIVIDSFSATPNTGKPSLVVDFICIAHDDINTITEYQWNFGDGNTDTTLTGTNQHTYTIPGTFTATCTAVNDNADQTTASTAIEVTNDVPIADAGPDQIIAGSSVELDGSASYDPDGTISSWEWSLTHTENSAYNKSASGEIVYLSNLEFGHYTVILTVSDNFGAQGVDEMFLSIAASTGDVYSQEDLDQARQGGHDQGYLEGMDEGLNNSGNTIAGIIEEGANGEKVIEGPVIIKGTLVIE